MRQVTLLAVGALTLAAAAASAAPLPRIAIEATSAKAEFINSATGARFLPKGFTYTVLDKIPDQAGFAHVTFDPGFYDPDAAESALATMHTHGFNVVRVILDSGDAGHENRGQYGIAGPPSAQGLYRPVVDNFVDFLKRARDNGIYVIASTYAIPQNRSFKDTFQSGRLADVDGVNRYYLTPGGIHAKAQYLKEIVHDVRSAGGTALLTSVLAWEIQVEVFVTNDSQPFSLHSGTVTTADGRSYDMGSARSRQACMDENIVNWATQVSAAIRAEDPQALTTAGIFTYSAVHKPGPNGLVGSAGSDPRFPARVLPLESSHALSFIDIHAYPKASPNYTFASDVESLEFGKWDFGAMPFLLGEFGANRRFFPTLESASSVVRRQQKAALDSGFAGTLFWTWNTPPVGPNEWWNAVESDQGLLRVLQQPP